MLALYLLKTILKAVSALDSNLDVPREWAISLCSLQACDALIHLGRVPLPAALLALDPPEVYLLLPLTCLVRLPCTWSTDLTPSGHQGNLLLFYFCLQAGEPEGISPPTSAAALLSAPTRDPRDQRTVNSKAAVFGI